MKRYFFIDTENVGAHGYNPLLGSVEATIEDTFIIAHNRRHGKISRKLVDKIASSKANYRIIEIFNEAKNAMDFSLTAELAYLLASEGTKAEYYIISRDKGFEVLTDFAKAHGCCLKIIPSFQDHMQQQVSQEEQKKVFSELLPNLTTKALNIAFQCYVNSLDKKTYHNKLQLKLQRDGHEVYVKTAYLFDK